jgi:iron complex transport system substrate-binding protein
MKFFKQSGFLLVLWFSALQVSAELNCQTPAADASRVAVAGGSITEIIYFLGEEHRLIAVDRTSNFPAAATQLPQIGYVRGLATEGLLSLKPTLVMGEDDMGPPEVLSQLSQTGIDWVRVPEEFSVEGIAAKVNCVAGILDVAPEKLASASKGLNDVALRLTDVERRTDSPTALIILLYQEGAAIAAGADTSGDGILAMAGFNNALADVSGWKPISAESMIKANPDYLIVTHRAVRTAGGLDKITQSPGVRLTRAGRLGRVIEMDGMSLLGFGPRTLEAAAQLAEVNASSAD